MSYYGDHVSRAEFYRDLARRYLNHLWFVPVFIALPITFMWVVGESFSPDTTFGRGMIVMELVCIGTAVSCAMDTMKQYRKHMETAQRFERLQRGGDHP